LYFSNKLTTSFLKWLPWWLINPCRTLYWHMMLLPPILWSIQLLQAHIHVLQFL